MIKFDKNLISKLCFLLLCSTLPHLGLMSTAVLPPNIVIITADDFGFDDVSFRGSDEFLTPNIDALAYHGKILNHFYVPPNGIASRAAALTGKYPIHTGMQLHFAKNSDAFALPTNLTTMPEIFAQAGYSTNLVGKWGLGFSKKKYTPTHRGFDYHYGFWGSHIDYFQRRAKVPKSNISLGYDFRRNMNVECHDLGAYVTDLLTSEAESIIQGHNRTRPLFLMVNHLATHRANEYDPLQAPIGEIKRFAYIKDRERRRYAAMVSKLDQSVGRIIRSLDRSKLLANSIIIFYSDNGAATQGTEKNAGSNSPLRGQKNTPWEGGVRVPAVIWSTMLSNLSTIVNQPIYVGDLLPSLATATGLKLPDTLQLDGIDLWHILEGPTDNNQTIERDIVHYLDDANGVISIMHGSYKYINGSTFYSAYDNVLGYREQYDIDPREERYVVEIRNSLVSQALKQFDEVRLSLRRIERIRNSAGISCGQMHRSCNTLVEECLFDVLSDPCEQHNLYSDQMHTVVLKEMHKLVKHYRKTVWHTSDLLELPSVNPGRHDCTWTNYIEDEASKELQTCYNFGAPCEASL